MKTRLLIFSTLVFLGTLAAGFAKAVCPVCVVAVGAGLGLSRWLGVDDVVSSIWIGAVLTALSLWTINWMRRKNWKFYFDSFVIFLAYYALTFAPLHYLGVLWHPLNTILRIDKIVFGTVVGTILFLTANLFSNFLKKKNNGKPYFPYQKVVLPFSVLLLVSLILWIII